MTGNMKIFLEAVSKREELREKLKAADESNVTAVALEAAKELGIPLTEADFERSAPTEVSDDEMEAVSGGVNECLCYIGGGGGGTTVSTDPDKRRVYGCGCAGYGQGGDGVEYHTLCWCIGMGAGDEEVDR